MLTTATAASATAAAATVVVVALIGSGDEKAGHRDGYAGGDGPPRVAAKRAEVLVVIVVAAAATRIRRVLAVVGKQHRLWAFRSVIHLGYRPGPDLRDATTRVDQLCAASGVGHDEVSLAGSGATRDALKSFAMIDEDLASNRVKRRRGSWQAETYAKTEHSHSPHGDLPYSNAHPYEC